MIKRNRVRIFKFLLFVLVAVPVFGFVTMWLWNWLMPPIFGVQAIRFGQALGLLVLSRILLGGFRGRLHGGGWRGGNWRLRMIERWEQMTPEQREKFREALRRGEDFRADQPSQ
jgi:hypothetical protein